MSKRVDKLLDDYIDAWEKWRELTRRTTYEGPRPTDPAIARILDVACDAAFNRKCYLFGRLRSLLRRGLLFEREARK